MRTVRIILCVIAAVVVAAPVFAIDYSHDCDYNPVYCYSPFCLHEHNNNEYNALCVNFGYVYASCHDRETGMYDIQCLTGIDQGSCHGTFFCGFTEDRRKDQQTFSLTCGGASDPVLSLVADAEKAQCQTARGVIIQCSCSDTPGGQAVCERVQ